MTTLSSRMAADYSIRELARAATLRAGDRPPTAAADLYTQFTSSQYSPARVRQTLGEHIYKNAFAETFKTLANNIDLYA